MREIKFRVYNTKPNSTSFKKGHKKIGGFVKDSKHTEISKEKVRQSLLNKTGKLARNWQGGKTPIQTIIRYSRRMEEWRKQVFERDNYTCRKCNTKNGNGKTIYLEAHHIKSFSKYPKLRFELNNGLTLCEDCHTETDNYKGKAVKNA